MKINRLFLSQLLLIGALLGSGSALSLGLRLNDSLAIANFINQKLQEANDHAAQSLVMLEFQYGAVDSVANRLSSSFGRKTSAIVLNSQPVELLIKLKKGKITVGHMELSFEIGFPNFFGQETKITERYLNNPYYVYLSFINIQEAFRGKGYSSQALAILHDFLDRLGIDYISLLLSSKAPYAGKTYIGAGYVFIDKTIADIQKWAATKDISKENAVEKFLEDSSQKLIDSAPYMIRFGQKK